VELAVGKGTAPIEKKRDMRSAIAASMSRSKREIPHYCLANEVNFATVLDWLASENAKRSIEERLIYAVVLLKAVARAVQSVPEMNGFWVNSDFKKSEDVHIGVAVSLRQGGLAAPAIHGADKKDLSTLMRELNDLVIRARAGSLKSSEMSDPTITVTNLGENSVDSVFGVIYPPQVALVGFGKVSSRKTIQTTLSGDHRASDGHRGALFLSKVEMLLQHPEDL
jgi:pyruvate dehydrogenase E2 component (dihydrolipoamide acetyltransferase)